MALEIAARTGTYPSEVTDAIICLELGISEYQLLYECTPQFVETVRLILHTRGIIAQERRRVAEAIARSRGR